jgi:hypothetical protein
MKTMLNQIRDPLVRQVNRGMKLALALAGALSLASLAQAANFYRLMAP